MQCPSINTLQHCTGQNAFPIAKCYSAKQTECHCRCNYGDFAFIDVLRLTTNALLKAKCIPHCSVML